MCYFLVGVFVEALKLQLNYHPLVLFWSNLCLVAVNLLSLVSVRCPKFVKNEIKCPKVKRPEYFASNVSVCPFVAWKKRKLPDKNFNLRK